MVEVLEPEDIRGRLADEARRIVARYEGRPLRSYAASSAGG